MTDALFDVDTGEVRRTAVLSEDGVYRYVLGRRWSEVNRACATFVMLNPSTADAKVDDRTIGRCVGFARDEWDMGAIHVLNLYALRSTDPKGLWRHPFPEGPDNDDHIRRHLHAHRATGWPLVAAWGAHARQDRVDAILALDPAAPWQCLGVTKAGAPKHPLYIAAGTPLQRWERR